MQHPIMTAVKGGLVDNEAAIREAYGLVAEGFREALTVSDLPPDVRDRLHRCLCHAAAMAGEDRRLAVAQAQSRP